MEVYDMTEPVDSCPVATGENDGIDEGEMEALLDPARDLHAVQLRHLPVQNCHARSLFV